MFSLSKKFLSYLPLCACSDTTKKNIPASSATASASPATVAKPSVTDSADATTPPPTPPLDQELAFAVETARSTGVPAMEIENWLAQARYQPSIIRAITRRCEVIFRPFSRHFFSRREGIRHS